MLETVRSTLLDKWPGLTLDITADNRHIVTLRGQCENWQTVVDIGHAAAKVSGVKNVVNELSVPGLSIPKKDYASVAVAGRALGVTDETDVLIIGAGVTGCGIARTLARYDLRILVVESGEDVCTGASKANNGDIHPGHAAKPGTLKAKLNVEGNRMYTRWAEELGFTLDRCGALGVVTTDEMAGALQFALGVAQMNGVDGAELVDAAHALELEPGLAKKDVDVKAGLWLPSMGLVEPYEVVVALAENAAENGVRFWFNCPVADILHENGQVTGAVTAKGVIKARYVINCAGVYADDISAMAGDKSFTIHPRRGTLAILDRNAVPEYSGLTEIVTMEALTSKNEESKGGGMCRTPEWNILLGPSATETHDKEDTATTPEDLAYAMGRNQNENVSYGNIIRIFGGVRPADYTEDFIIEMSPVTHGFVNVAGIQSPGLAAAPAIAQMVEGIVTEDMQAAGTPPAEKPGYSPRRQTQKPFRHLTREEQDERIRQNPAYGRIVCRCESITEGEIIDAIHSPVPPTTVDAIKRRTRAGMGRCQGGFCQPRVLELLARELGREWTDINLHRAGSNILLQPTRPAADANKGGAK